MGTFGKIVLRWIEIDKLDKLDRLDRLDAENWIKSFVSLCAFATWWQKKS